MENDKMLIAIACKMIAVYGDRTVERMDSMVADHVAVKDTEGAAFWGDVASTVRRLRAGISIAEEGQSDADR